MPFVEYTDRYSRASLDLPSYLLRQRRAVFLTDTICLGLAASMGAVLLAAGTRGKRFALPNSEVMIHQVMGEAQGQAADVEIAAAHIGRIKARLNRLLAEHTGQPLERICRDTDRNYFLDAQAAVDYGLVDAIRSELFRGTGTQGTALRRQPATARRGGGTHNHFAVT